MQKAVDNRIWSLRGMQFLFYSTMTFIITFLPMYYQNEGLRPSQIGVVMAVIPLVSIFAQPLWGMASDRVGNIRKMIMIVLVGSLIMSYGIFASSSFGMILGGMFLFAIFFTPTQPLLDSMTILSVQQMNRNYGSVRLWGSLGFCFTAWWAGHVLTHLGLERMGFLYIGLLLLTILCAFTMKNPEVRGERPSVSWQHARRLLLTPSFAWLMVLIFALTVPHRLNDVMLGLYMLELGGTEQHAGFAWMVAAFSEVFVFPFMGYVLIRFREMNVLFVCALLYGLRWFLNASVNDPTMLIAVQLTHGVTHAAFFQATIHYLTRIVPDYARTTGQSLFMSVFVGIAGITGSLLGGWLMSHYGGSWMYTVSGFGSLVAALLFFVTIIWTKRREPTLVIKS